jgi:pilus assembly protein CpaB
MLETKVIPNRFVEPSAVTSLDRVSGMKVVVPIHKGEQITLNKLATVAQARGESLAMATPVGKRAITISVDQITGLSGMIKPGDYVDVIALLPIPVQRGDNKQTTQVATIPLFQKVLVVAVGNELISGGSGSKRKHVISFGSSRSSAKRKDTSIVTLALPPREASLLSFVAEQGRVRLVMRSPADAKVKLIPPANWQTLFQYIDSTLPKQPRPVVREPKKIEIYRGLQKDYITISQ